MNGLCWGIVGFMACCVVFLAIVAVVETKRHGFPGIGEDE